MADPWAFKTPCYQVKYSGIFDYEGLMRVIIRWLKARRFKFDEKLYEQKPGNELGGDIVIFWEAELKINDFYKFKMYINHQAWDINEVEVVKDGVKKILTKGKLELYIYGEAIFDADKRFQENKLTRFLASFYYKWLAWTPVTGDVHDTLHYRVIKLQTVVKEYLGAMGTGNPFERYAGRWK